MLEDNYIKIDQNGNEIDIIRAAGSSQVIICSNSTFSFHMFTYRMLNYNSEVIIYYPRDFIYLDFQFLDLMLDKSKLMPDSDISCLNITMEQLKRRIAIKNITLLELIHLIMYVIHQQEMYMKMNTTKNLKKNLEIKYYTLVILLILFDYYYFLYVFIQHKKNLR